MANSIELAKLYAPLLQEVYQQNALSYIFENNDLVSTMGTALASEVYVPEMTMSGLGTYNKSTGYPVGDVNLKWVSLKLKQDRGRSFAIDVVDDMESMKLAGARIMGAFMREKVVPEVDAYRFATWAMGSKDEMRANMKIATSNDMVNAIDQGVTKLDDASVPTDGRILLMTPAVYAGLKSIVWNKRMYLDSNDNIGKNVLMYDNMRVIRVPSDRFYSKCNLKTDGYDHSDGKALNFMIIHPSAVFAVTKHNPIKSAEPDVNMDAMRFSMRIYHDAFIVPNHENGIYVHSVEKLSV